ncbi:hypothetical protein ACFQS8_15010 [Hirschia litorea]|uniref:Uncharacterized protein n=2 Tax=Hirschia litorea TaxID=1199156 RepID=A0ABW2IPS9_9PROT
MDHLHRSLGIERQHIAAVSEDQSPFGEIGLKRGVRFPFSPYGASLQGVSFYQIWLKEWLGGQAIELCHYNPSFSSLHQSQGFWRIDPIRYEKLLLKVSKLAGIGKFFSDAESVSLSDYELVVDTANHEASKDEACISVQIGRSKLSGVNLFEFDLMVLHQDLLTLIQNFPHVDLNRAGQQELDRKLNSVLASFEDMQTILADDLESVSLSNRVKERINVWLDIGRIPPYEDDFFAPHEWTAIMHQCVGIPQHYSRLVDSLQPSHISDHLDNLVLSEGHENG